MPKGYPKAKMVEKKILASARLLEKYKGYISKRDEYIDYNVRGEKARKLAEIAEVVKLMNGGDAFKIAIPDFEKAYGSGVKGRNYVKHYMKKFGIKNPRVEFSADMANIWMPVDHKRLGG